MIAVFQFTLLLKNLPENKTDWETVTNTCINIMTVSWFVNIIFAGLYTFKNFVDKIKSYFKTAKVLPDPDPHVIIAFTKNEVSVDYE